MNKIKLRRALNELDVILNEAVPEDKLNKISSSFLGFIRENKDKNWVFQYDDTKEIDEQNVLDETKLLLGLIYLNYWATEEEKQEAYKTLDENEEKYIKQVSLDNLFNNNKKVTVEQTATAVQNLPYVYKRSFMRKIVVFIKKLFRKGY